VLPVVTKALAALSPEQKKIADDLLKGHRGHHAEP